MNYHIYYYRPWRCWMGYWSNANGDQLAEAVNSPTKEGVLVELGKQHELAQRINSEGFTFLSMK